MNTRTLDAMARQVQRMLAGTRQALRGVRTALLRTSKIQLLSAEGLAGEQLDRHELFQQFGFTSAPPAGTQVIVLPLGGRTSAAVVVATEHGGYRFQLGADGEVAIYNQWGDYVHLRADRSIHLVAQAKVVIDTDVVEINAGTSMTINTPELIVDAATVVELNTPLVDASTAITAGTDITAAGQVADAGGTKTMAGMRGVFNAHVHPENNTPTNVTSATATPM
jgi:phage baseplate assembly protein V